MNLRSFALSDIGLVRTDNEDSCLAETDLGVFAVADGIGGLPAGAQASQHALRVLTEWFRSRRDQIRPDYSEALRMANEEVFLLGRRLSPRHGIGTTLTLAHFTDRSMQVLHVGDSALYRLRDGRLNQLTVEHNLENEMRARAARGEPTYVLTENRAALTRCVGQPPPLQGDLSSQPVESGDRYLLCTDGITRCIGAAEIAQQLAEAPTPQQACGVLVALARDRGGMDNATAVAIFVD